MSKFNSLSSSFCKMVTLGPTFTIEDLPLMLILIIADNFLNDSLCCSYKYNCCWFGFTCKLYILLLTFLINLSDICITLPEIFWIKLKLGKIIMKLGPGDLILTRCPPFVSVNDVRVTITYNGGLNVCCIWWSYL